jgi:hypothetical protein
MHPWPCVYQCMQMKRKWERWLQFVLLLCASLVDSDVMNRCGMRCSPALLTLALTSKRPCLLFRPFSHQFEHVLHEYGRKLERDAHEGDAAKADDAGKAEALKKWSHEDQSIKMLGARLHVCVCLCVELLRAQIAAPAC